jgi:molybdopterin converting factor small subunit
MVKVKVRLHNILSYKIPKYSKSREINLKQDTMFGLIQQLGLSGDEVSYIIVNGIMVDKNRHLNEGDEVLLFPSVAGG